VAVELRDAQPEDLAGVRGLIEEYVRSLGVDLGFQEIETELSDLAAAYAPPRGGILVGVAGGQLAGCVALRPLEPGTCEMKRLYVRPPFRRTGLGKRLAVAAIEKARDLGYDRMRIDTLPQMQAARRLYAELGFRTIEPYRFNPVEGTAFMELALR
jgi:GNAT superfamily N-acetyltransferase